jgi:hypothetical protein
VSGTKVSFTNESNESVKSELERQSKSKARFHLSHFIPSTDRQTIKENTKNNSSPFQSIISHLRSVLSNNKVKR